MGAVTVRRSLLPRQYPPFLDLLKHSLFCQVDFSHATWITDNEQVGLDLRHAAQSIKVIVGQVCVLSADQRVNSKYLLAHPLQTLPELSPLLRKMGSQESTEMSAAQALHELESIVQSVPASRMSAPLN